MIPVPVALEAHLAGEVTSHCFVWIIQRPDNVKLSFTDHDCVLSIEGVNCEPMTGLSGSEAATQLGLSVAGGEVEGVLSSARVKDSDIEQGHYDGARVEVWLVNWRLLISACCCAAGQSARLPVLAAGSSWS